MSSMMAQSDVQQMTDGPLGVAEHSYEDGLPNRKWQSILILNAGAPSKNLNTFNLTLPTVILPNYLRKAQIPIGT